MSRNYNNWKKKSYARKYHMSAIAKKFKRATKKRETGYISSKSDSSKSIKVPITGKYCGSVDVKKQSVNKKRKLNIACLSGNKCSKKYEIVLPQPLLWQNI